MDSTHVAVSREERAGRVASPAGHVLTIVVPALDEEQAIGGTLRRCLDARAAICERAGLADVEVVLVNDGSTDRTEEIARGFPEVSVLGYDRNRGYGAAIKAGFQFGRGDLVGFLDGDGTCDPHVFGELCAACIDGADLALGSRMGADSEMPRIRRVGNALFAWMLGALSGSAVGDTASGMRVIRRDRLDQLYPLPDGLQFTPAMSAKVLLSGSLRLVEHPMPYAERVGRSKLSVVKDGLRFFRVIMEAAMCYRPGRPLGFLAAGLLAVAALLVAGPSWAWLTLGALEEWMIYRLSAASLLAILTAVLVNGAVVAERVAAEAHGRPLSGFSARFAWFYGRRGRVVVGLLLVASAVVVSWPGLVEYLGTGHVTMHWSRVMLSSLLGVLAVVLGVTSFLLNMLELIRIQREERGPVVQPDRVRMASPRERAAAAEA